MIAIDALALATVVRPDGPTPATLERAVRSACVAGWRVVEVVLAGEGLRARLAARESGLGARIEAVFGAFGREIPTRSEALAMLRRARHDGVLDGNLDMAALVAGCGRVGDAPAIAAGRRRVRTLSIDSLRRALADHRALAVALGDGAIGALLVDTARAVFRHASRNDKDLARWAVPPTGTTSRDQALSSFVELIALTALADELDSMIASVIDGTAGAEQASLPSPEPPISTPATGEEASSPSPEPPISAPATIEEPASRTAEPPISVPATVEQAPLPPEPPISVPAAVEQAPSPPEPPISVPATVEQAPSRPRQPGAEAKIAAPRSTDEPAEESGNAVRPRRWIALAVFVIAIVAVLAFYATR